VSWVARPKVLVIDDDRGLVDLLSIALEDAGFAVDRAHDGKAGWERFTAGSPDLVVLDLLMPELDGLELCRRIREHHATPVVMLTSRDDEMDKVLGLDLGADDYVTKPFSTRELIARVRAALRRVSMSAGSAEALEIRRLRLDRSKRDVVIGETRVMLTATEFELLWTLASRPGHVFDRDKLMTVLYGEIVVSERTLDTFVKRVRRKLRAVEPTFDELETVRSIGYRYKE
jgi:two-component system OmpR family response regulator